MFPILSTDKASMKSQVQIFDMFSSLLAKYLGIAVIYVKYKFKKKQSDCTILHSQQQGMKVPGISKVY